MSRGRISQWVLLAASILLVACQPAYQQVSTQQIVEWPEQNLLFIADGRTGQVRSFFLGSGAPVLVAQTRGVLRTSVRDLQLDERHGKLWVLGDDGVYEHEARGLELVAHYPMTAKDVAALEVKVGRAMFVADTARPSPIN